MTAIQLDRSLINTRFTLATSEFVSAVGMVSLVANTDSGTFPCEGSFGCDECLANTSVSSFLPFLLFLSFDNHPIRCLLATIGVLWVSFFNGLSLHCILATVHSTWCGVVETILWSLLKSVQLIPFCFYL